MQRTDWRTRNAAGTFLHIIHHGTWIKVENNCLKRGREELPYLTKHENDYVPLCSGQHRCSCKNIHLNETSHLHQQVVFILRRKQTWYEGQSLTMNIYWRHLWFTEKRKGLWGKGDFCSILYARAKDDKPAKKNWCHQSQITGEKEPHQGLRGEQNCDTGLESWKYTLIHREVLEKKKRCQTAREVAVWQWLYVPIPKLYFFDTLTLNLLLIFC